MINHVVIWSPKAKLSYYKILEYLDSEWTFKELKSFVSRTKEVLALISRNPKIYPYSKQSDTHRCVLTKQVSLIYRIKATQVET